jgi:hypothetical protein
MGSGKSGLFIHAYIPIIIYIAFFFGNYEKKKKNKIS